MKAVTVLWCMCVLLGQTKALSRARRFPDDFLFGAATAAYQIEGGWNADGKGENIWDYLIHTYPNIILDGSNADVAANSYYNYKRDVEMMRELGLDVYRFSVSWSRILPEGFVNEINHAGLAYYNDLVNEMLKYNITPVVTLYHWDLPQSLQEFGGFMNPLFRDWFEDYARIVFSSLGDRVKMWITFNEPREICLDGYGSLAKAPMINVPGIADYICAKNLLIAHANVYHIYNKEFKPIQGGKCGITTSISSYEPLENNDKDKFAVEIMKQGMATLYTDPIFSNTGGFPVQFSQIVEEKSMQQGFTRSRLPSFSEEEKEFVRGSADFLGINHYGGALVSATKHLQEHPVPSLYDDISVGTYVPEEWPKSVSSWLAQTPNSINLTLSDIRDRYNNPEVYITENGWSTRAGLDDDLRVTYYRAAWESVLDALDAGCNLKGYMAWSLMDNFEWREGFSERFGLYEVNYSHPMRTRTPRKSAFVYKHLINTRIVDHSFEPDTDTRHMAIDDNVE